jgi:hypothetical protein
MTARTEWHADGLRALLTSGGMRQTLDGLCFTITAHAVPHSGVDTGRLINSMGHKIVELDGELVAKLGSGATDGVQPVAYWAQHWAGRDAPNQASLPATDESGPRRPHTTRPAPTKPYTKALSELGINAHVEPGGFES